MIVFNRIELLEILEVSINLVDFLFNNSNFNRFVDFYILILSSVKDNCFNVFLFQSVLNYLRKNYFKC